MFAEIADLIRSARRLLFITGAGISADSGLPTYRGTGGLYADRHTPEGLSIEEVLSGDTFQVRPDLTWRYLLQIERHCRGAQPNFAHRLIAHLESVLPAVDTLTQNVDGLHAVAGSRRLIEIHGSLRTLRCCSCRYSRHVDSYADLDDGELPPPCPRCLGHLRPDVVLFGESLRSEHLDQLDARLAEGVDAVFSIGTSSLFPYIAAPMAWAHRQGVPAIEINPDDTEVSHLASHRIRLGAVAAMRQIAAALPAPLRSDAS